MLEGRREKGWEGAGGRVTEGDEEGGRGTMKGWNGEMDGWMDDSERVDVWRDERLRCTVTVCCCEEEWLGTGCSADSNCYICACISTAWRGGSALMTCSAPEKHA